MSHWYDFFSRFYDSSLERLYAEQRALAVDALGLRPGGRCVIVDVHAERLGLQGWMVNRIAGADIRRRFWEPLERAGRNFTLSNLPYRQQHGGQIMLAVADKPA
jgi:hypothetical protein